MFEASPSKYSSPFQGAMKGADVNSTTGRGRQGMHGVSISRERHMESLGEQIEAGLHQRHDVEAFHHGGNRGS